MEISYCNNHGKPEHINNHVGTTIWICCNNEYRKTFPQKVFLESTHTVKLYDKKGNLSKKEIAVNGVGIWNILQMFTDKQECIKAYTRSIVDTIKSIKGKILDLESDIIKHENLIIEANKL